MRIEQRGASELVILENIKSIDDFVAIQQAVTRIVDDGSRDLLLNIPDSFSMPSSVIGLLIQLVNEGNVRLKMKIGDATLFELLEEMSLAATFNASRI